MPMAIKLQRQIHFYEVKQIDQKINDYVVLVIAGLNKNKTWFELFFCVFFFQLFRTSSFLFWHKIREKTVHILEVTPAIVIDAHQRRNT